MQTMVKLFDQTWVQTIGLGANEGFCSIKTACGLLRSSIQLKKGHSAVQALSNFMKIFTELRRNMLEP